MFKKWFLSRNTWILIKVLLSSQSLSPARILCATCQRLLRACGGVKSEYNGQRHVWHLTSISSLPRSYYCMKVLSTAFALHRGFSNNRKPAFLFYVGIVMPADLKERSWSARIRNERFPQFLKFAFITHEFGILRKKKRYTFNWTAVQKYAFESQFRLMIDFFFLIAAEEHYYTLVKHSNQINKQIKN